MIASHRGAPPARTRFVVPAGSEASTPPERRGIARDGVRLLVVTPHGLVHRRFRDLPGLLSAGDVLVVNTSATLAAALHARHDDGRIVPLHVAGWLDPSLWIVEVRLQHNDGPDLNMREGDVLRLPGALMLRLVHPHPDSAAVTSRLWVAAASPTTEPLRYLARHGHPVTYRHVAADLPLSAYQTVYAAEPGSAEMPSAGRPFTIDLLGRVAAAGVIVAPLTLHAGLSSPEAHEPPAPEPYSVPESTARLVVEARRAGRRVIAVGTTVVRALETIGENGLGGSGWTDLVLGPDRPARLVSGLITGLHLPESSHLQLLEAVASAPLVDAAYLAAVQGGYLWHEFGDSMLFLP